MLYIIISKHVAIWMIPKIPSFHDTKSYRKSIPVHALYNTLPMRFRQYVVYTTSLTPPPFIEMPVPSQESEQSCIEVPAPSQESEQSCIEVPVPSQESEQSCIEVPLPSQESEQSCIEVPVPSQESEQSCIEVPVPSQESEQSCICVLWISILPLSTILIFILVVVTLCKRCTRWNDISCGGVLIFRCCFTC